MGEANAHSSEATALGELAREVLIDLYRAIAGHTPKAVRVYGEDDALLLLLRFDPSELAGVSEISFEPLIDTTFIALPSMIATAVQRREHINDLDPRFKNLRFSGSSRERRRSPVYRSPLDIH